MTLNYNISRQQAADILGISTRTLDRYIRKWLISYKKVGNRIFLSEEEIILFKKKLENNEVVNETELIWWGDNTQHYEVEIQSSSDSGLKKYEDDDLSEIVNLLREKDQIIEQKNKIIFSLQHKIGELESKLETYVALPNYTEEKDKIIKEKESLLEEKYNLVYQLKKIKFINLVLILISLVSVLSLLFFILSLFF